MQRRHRGLDFWPVAAGNVGNLLEWYDFVVFAFLAPVIGARFFPSADALSGLINAFGVFAVGSAMARSLRRSRTSCPPSSVTVASRSAPISASRSSGERRRSLPRGARRATSALYHAASAVMLAWEAWRIHEVSGDARRLLLSRLVLDHRLTARDPLAPAAGMVDAQAATLLLDDRPVSMVAAAAAAAG